VDGGKAKSPRYIRKPFRREPDFGVTIVNYAVADLVRNALSE